MANIGELWMKIGTKLDTQGLQKNIATITGAFAGVNYGLKKYLDDTISRTSKLKNFELQTGLTADRLQELQQVAQSVNLDFNAEDITRSLTTLQQKLIDIKLGQGDIAPFRFLGISPFQDVFSLLKQLKESVKTFDDPTATNLIQRLGLDPKFLSILRLTDAEFNKLSRNLFLNEKQREQVLSLGKAMKQLQLNLIGLKDQAVAKLAPELKELTDKFFKWMLDNKDKIINTISSISSVFIDFSRAVGYSFDFLSNLLDKITGTQKGMQILGVALTGILGSYLGLFKPLSLALIGIIGLLDDIQAWKEGRENLLGGLYDVVSKIPDLGVALGVSGAFIGLSKLVPVLKEIYSLTKKIAVAEFAGGIGGGLVKGVKAGVKAIGLTNPYVLGAIGAYGAYETYKHKDEIKDYVGKKAEEISNMVNNFSINIYSNTNDPQRLANDLQEQLKELSMFSTRNR